ncbi:MAG: hypothetical protein AAF310_03945 [Myxococcota bacterium]
MVGWLRVAIGLTVVACSGCFSVEVSYSAIINVTEALQKQEEQFLSQLPFGNSDNDNQKQNATSQTEASLETIKQRGSCDEALAAALILQQDPQKRFRQLPEQMPAILKGSEYAPGNPNNCADVNIAEWLERQVITNVPVAVGLFMPRKEASQVDSDISSLPLEKINKCIDLTKNPKYLQISDLNLEVETDSNNFPQTSLIIYKLPDDDIRKHGLDWNPNVEEIRELKGSTEVVATTSQLQLAAEQVQVVQLQWKSGAKKPFFNGLLAQEHAALLELNGLKLKEDTVGVGEEAKQVIFKPSGTVRFKAFVKFDVRVYGTQLSYCGSLIPEILAR